MNNFQLDGFAPSKLGFETQDAFERVVDNSITERYDGPLDRSEGRHGEILYRPIDTDHVVQLLDELWDELLTPEAINEAFDRLTGWDMQNNWPRGYCEADEAERPLSDFRTEEDEAVDWFEAVARGESSSEI